MSDTRHVAFSARARSVADHPVDTRILAAAALVIVAAFLVHVIYLNVVAEDSYITFRFARNFVNGHGLVWNIGEPPVEGYTNFLWLLISALILKLQWNLAIAMQVVGVGVSLVAGLFTYKYGRRWLGLTGMSALLPCAFLALSGPFATWAGSGLETNLFCALIIAGAYWYVGYKDSGAYRQLVLCCIVLLLATLTRPEGLMVFGLVGGLSLLFTPTSIRRAVNELAIAGVFFVVPVVIYCLWRHSYFGYWLPNTFYAKTGGGLNQYLRGLKYASLFGGYFILPLLLPLVIIVKSSSGPAIARSRTEHVGLWTCGTILAFYTLYIVLVGGDYMAMFRFFVPLLPFVYLAFGAMVQWIWDRVSLSTSRRAVAAAAVAVAAAVTLVFSTPVEGRYYLTGLPKPSFYLGCYHGVQYERQQVARMKVIGQFFHDYKKAPDESLGVFPIGAISYIADMPIHSITAIVDAHIAHGTATRDGLPLGTGFPGHEKADINYVVAKRPTYILYFAPERDLTPEPRVVTLNGPEGALYRSQSVWVKDEVNRTAGYLTFLELKTPSARVSP